MNHFLYVQNIKINEFAAALQKIKYDLYIKHGR